MPLTRIKQVLIAIGLLTVIGTLALASLIAYLWWDAGRQTAEIDTDDAEAGNTDADSPIDDANASTEAIE